MLGEVVWLWPIALSSHQFGRRSVVFGVDQLGAIIYSFFKYDRVPELLNETVETLGARMRELCWPRETPGWSRVWRILSWWPFTTLELVHEVHDDPGVRKVDERVAHVCA